jgi:3',5'-cyclic AMP phosphodiesterase CpdA
MMTLLRAVVLLGFAGLPAPAKEPAQTPAAPARIALLSDLHLTAMTNADIVAAHARFHQAIADVNAARVDLVLIAGDLTEWGRPQEFARLREHLRLFDAPVWVVPGNHDAGNKHFEGKTKPGSTSAWHVRLYESRLGPSCFARTHAGVRVIGLNSVILGSGMPRERAQWTWLEKELARPDPPPTVVLTHFPPFEQKPEEESHEYWNIEREPRERLLRLLQQAGVKAVFSGHLHRDLTNQYEGMLLFTTRPVSFGLPKDKQPEGWTLVTVPARGPIQLEPRTLAR